MEEFEHLKIRLEEIKKATDSFRSKVIGVGGFGKVYEGEVSHSRGESKVAIKRLSREFGQGDPEFLKEIVMLSRHTHKNLISLLGFCDEDGEKILVYEHASNGSLDRHLSSIVLTWTQRLKICLDAAKGLAYLHDHKGTHQRVLHRDIKSGNILLDENWNAKISDMGLSKMGPANQPHSVIFTNVVGTPGYCDPQYMSTFTLTKESDVYSFGVVLFEVLCGRLCFTFTNKELHILVPMWKESYKHNKLDMIIFKDLTAYIDSDSLQIFSSVAYQCLQYSREQRPTMSHLVKELENALRFQEHHDKKKREGTKQIDTEDSGSSDAISEKETKEPREELVHFDVTMSNITLAEFLGASAEVAKKNTYGTDYKIELENGDHLFVRRMKIHHFRNPWEIETEFNMVGKIRHPNLLTAMAYYLGPKGEKALIYDYMRKKSLHASFHDTRIGVDTLNLRTRIQLVNGVARGLHCLHIDHNIVHGNLTTNNILVDQNLNPTIIDIELSRLITEAAYFDFVASEEVHGYQAPEVSKLKKVDMKADVYSFGVIMLELLTGKSQRSLTKMDSTLTIQLWVASFDKTRWINEIMDYTLSTYTNHEEDQFVKTSQLAMDCVHSSPQDRPNIQQVLDKLEEITLT